MTALVLPPIPAPSVDYQLVAPMLVVFGAGVIGVAVEALVPAARRARTQLLLAAAGLLAALAAVLWAGLAERAEAVTTAELSIAVDGPALFLQGTLVVLALLTIWLVVDRNHDAFAARPALTSSPRPDRGVAGSVQTQTEVLPLLMFSVGGLMLLTAANDLLTMFVALEVTSLPLYLLCGLGRRRRLLSQEAALKYFLLGSFSAAFFLYGTALAYGAAESVTLGEIGAARPDGDQRLLLAGMALLCVALLFKIGAVPFHAWTPDVYQGAPTPVTAFMAALTKVAAFGALLRLLTVAFDGQASQWRPIIWAVCAVTMLIGVLLAIVQQDIKRMLAFSAIAHAGFLLTALMAPDESAVQPILFYLAVYGVATVGAFAIVTLVRRSSDEALTVASWGGLGKTSPALAGAFALFLLTFAGIPLTSGFVGKFAVFSAAMQAGATVLVVVGVLASVIAAVFYARIIVTMFFTEPGQPELPAGLAAGRGARMVALVAAVFTIGVGVVPGPLLALASQAAGFVQ